MKGLCARLWKKHAFDLGVIGIAVVLGFACYLFLAALANLSGAMARFGLPSIAAIVLVLPEDPTVARLVGGAVGVMVVIGGYSDVFRFRTLIGMALVTVGLVGAMTGNVAMLLPHYFLISTLNSGPSGGYAYTKGGDSYWVDDIIWIVLATCLVVCALLLKRKKVRKREVVPWLSVVITIGLVLSAMAVSWSLLRLLASSEMVLEIGLGGQKLPYITELAVGATPKSTVGRVLGTFGVGILVWIGVTKKPFGTFPRYFSAIALTVFLLCCVILMFMVEPYYQAYAVSVGVAG